MKKVKGASLNDGNFHDHHHELYSRRDFLTRLGLFAAGSSLVLGATPVKALQSSTLFRKLTNIETERILVLIQLSGGNDGLNTVIPYRNDEYYKARPTIAIQPSDVVDLNGDLGLHPSLEPLKNIWDNGSMGIVQNVGYPNPVLSHFTSSDVWQTSSDSDNIKTTGWLGRYLDGDSIEQELQSISDIPLAVNIGGASSLIFKGPDSNTAMTFSSVGALEQVTQQGKIFSTENLPDTAFGNEMRFVREQINSSFKYAEAIQTAFKASINQAEYESREISDRLRIVARLIKGDLGSKIYMVTLNGFDTHTDQLSRQTNLFKLLSNAIKSFYDDLAAANKNKDVLTMTFSEFGRRVEQNGQGTDHGTAAPVMLFSDSLESGIFGLNPKLSREDLDLNGNLKYEFDFRSVYSTVLIDWFGVPETEVQEVIGASFQRIGFLGNETAVSLENDAIPSSFTLHQNYPNPFNPTTTIFFVLPQTSAVRLEVFDIQGRSVAVLTNRKLQAGEHRISFNASELASGMYVYKLRAGNFVKSKMMTLIK